MNYKIWIFIMALSLFALPRQSTAAPRPLIDDIQIRQLMQVPERTMRIAKDPRDRSLYLQTASGDIFNIYMLPPDAEIAPLVARGEMDSDSGNFSWTQFNLEGDIPAGVPIEAIRDVAKAGSLSDTNPVNSKLYLLNADDNTIMVLPRTVVASAPEIGFAFLRALYIDDTGIFYVIRDVERARSPFAKRLYSSADHGLNDTQGLAIGPDGTMYVGGNRRQGDTNIITIVKGVLDPATGQRSWSTLARTEPIPRGDVGAFNHFHPAVAVDHAGRFVYVNSGSRTEHGELAEMNGQFPDLREAPLSSAILRVPTDGEELLIPAEAEALAASGFYFSDGHRNAFDLTIGPEGELFATENGPDWDMSDEINWVREGHHYGFPWRMGEYDNPQRFPDYDPSQDPLLQNNSWAKQNNLFYNDPTFPPPPVERFAEPILNLGPDANSYRALDGQIIDGSDNGKATFTLTAHSSPLGLVFDSDMAMAPPFKGSGFVLRIGGSIASLINPFADPDQDLLQLELEKTPDGENYQARVRRLVAGFDSPIDAEIIDNRIFVVEWGDTRGLWEITLPKNIATAVEEEAVAVLPTDAVLMQNYPNPFNPNTTIEYRVDAFVAVEVAIFDALGQKVRTLIAAEQAPGLYRLQWDGRTDMGLEAASGVYMYRLIAGSQRETRRLTLIK